MWSRHELDQGRFQQPGPARRLSRAGERGTLRPDRADGRPAAEALRDVARQARKVGHVHVGSEHILLALAAHDGGHAHAVLNRLGLPVAVIRREVVERLDALGVLTMYS
ncbi:Clp protease N-terminal domain-containing protein [Nonomuraea typhae]|uniref:Clp protease N-terminal domain-containing protein n=1 Tax=Nonomuraea typhae TaxID=2603600 RepID=A0ABW7Z120_9ACTN